MSMYYIFSTLKIQFLKSALSNFLVNYIAGKVRMVFCIYRIYIFRWTKTCNSYLHKKMLFLSSIKKMFIYFLMVFVFCSDSFTQFNKFGSINRAVLVLKVMIKNALHI